MLVLSRKLGEKIYISDNICITVVDIDRGKIRLGIEAPRDVPIFRQELVSAPHVAPAGVPATAPTLAAGFLLLAYLLRTAAGAAACPWSGSSSCRKIGTSRGASIPRRILPRSISTTVMQMLSPI